jgi:hypothetical protein
MEINCIVKWFLMGESFYVFWRADLDFVGFFLLLSELRAAGVFWATCKLPETFVKEIYKKRNRLASSSLLFWQFMVE